MAGKWFNLALGVLFWGGILVVSLVYEIHHGGWLRALAAVVMLAVILYSTFHTAKQHLNGKEPEPGRYLVGSAPRRHYIATRVIVGMCVAASLLGWMLPNHWYLNGGSVGYTPVVVQHEWWRVVTSAFLHVNTMHLWVNMAALWYLGEETETLIGAGRFIFIYAVAALGGGLLVVVTHQEHTIGASGAIYGLLGAALFFGWSASKHGFHRTAKRLVAASSIVVGINLLFSLAVPVISLAGHVGGLVSGFFAAMAVGVSERQKLAWMLTDNTSRSMQYTCDADGAVYYNGPARFALERGWISAGDVATAIGKDVMPQVVLIAHASPDELLITCPVPPDALPSLMALAASPAAAPAT